MTLSTNLGMNIPIDGRGRFLGGVPRPKVDLSERFWAKVEKAGEDDCWNWTASCDSSGYGSFTVHELGGRKTWSAHRMAFSLKRGAIPNGLHVLHHCDNRRCTNPKHLFLGTNDDNNRDKMEKGRQAKGEASGRANLSEADVRFLREAVRSGNAVTTLAKQAKLPHCTVYSAVYGETWGHVDGALTPPKSVKDLVGQTKSITARELRDAMATYVGLVARGMKITVTKNGEIIAVMSSPTDPAHN